MSSILENHLTPSYDVTQASAHIFIATLYPVDDSELVSPQGASPSTYSSEKHE